LLLATLLIIAALVVNGQRRERNLGGGERVDVKRIERLSREGRLGIRPGEFARKVQSPEEEAGP